VQSVGVLVRGQGWWQGTCGHVENTYKLVVDDTEGVVIDDVGVGGIIFVVGRVVAAALGHQTTQSHTDGPSGMWQQVERTIKHQDLTIVAPQLPGSL